MVIDVRNGQAQNALSNAASGDLRIEAVAIMQTSGQIRTNKNEYPTVSEFVRREAAKEKEADVREARGRDRPVTQSARNVRLEIAAADVSGVLATTDEHLDARSAIDEAGVAESETMAARGYVIPLIRARATEIPNADDEETVLGEKFEKFS